MNNEDQQRIITAVDFWVKTKLEQQQLSALGGRAQGGTRASVTGGKHLAGVNQLILEELERLGITGLKHYTNRQATVPGYYRASKSWDLLVLRDDEPALALEYKSMTGSEGKNLNNRIDEVIGAAQDLHRAQQTGLLPKELKRGYIFLMEVTPAVLNPVGTSTKVGTLDPIFESTCYLERMAIMCERLRNDGLYGMAWALGVVRNPIGIVEPRPSVNWDRFKADLRQAFTT
ncbi:PaeR7I family type II restriction endonuclease [Mobiluncus mulieris]|uniref:Restriction endonuclease XhoI n=2 Tax=Mobiluncus mulieris TaxID=2052 RepID=E0QQ27_9ACTO|nr:PaeR7I family type II restriction endonuclease [Mobiluncus mulieris]EEJ54786.1 restriction endonuclease XhoI [Mobiluncus mulieris ATCC 35243]EFM46407.1 restriction endonuclease XhoI [Mobiluncus mulieris ATCC 35239]MCU9968392.1 restriction endonuclease [Mobiluncus mulieris]MCU9970398.1 restriction endonuclease [Mobiluncus mulieris]MCU9972624.1 restriction endonuclease [Mobiluncus mulieris]